DEVAVVARSSQWADVPANVGVHLFDARRKVSRSIAFERAFGTASTGADAVLVHMVPQFAVLAAPLAKVRRPPLLLWSTHWHAGRALRVATALVDVVLSVERASFPLVSSKVRGIGHAIDVKEFDAPPLRAHDGPLRLLSTGRTARWKGLATALDALALGRRDGLRAELDIYGPSLTTDERIHRAELEDRIAGDA